MAAEKGKIPKHIRHKKFYHPQADHSIIQIFNEIDDPLMNAWSADNRICLGQIKVDDKSNEIIAMPQLMEMLDLKGTIITADAMNTQKATAKKAIDKEADYVLPVKGNQPTLLKEKVGKEFSLLLACAESGQKTGRQAGKQLIILRV